MSNYSTHEVLNAIAAAQKALSDRKDEVNRLNVFPVPDGDTGTNMSLTMQMVVDNLAKLPIGASSAEIRKTIAAGALMGARGNSGVIRHASSARPVRGIRRLRRRGHYHRVTRFLLRSRDRSGVPGRAQTG